MNGRPEDAKSPGVRVNFLSPAQSMEAHRSDVIGKWS